MNRNLTRKLDMLESVHGTDQQRLSASEIDAVMVEFERGYRKLACDPAALERLGETNVDTYRAAIESSRDPRHQRFLASMSPVDLLL